MIRKTQISSFVLLATSLLLATQVAAQDNVFVKSGSRSKKTGKIVGMTKDSVTLQSGGKKSEIQTDNIRKITYGGEPNSLDRARDRYDSGRFDDCVSELAKINAADLSPLIRQEMAYLSAFANAEISLRGGNVSAKNAGKAMKDFIDKYSNSYRVYPAQEMLGNLFLAFGRADFAEKEFQKLSSSGWPEFKIKGLFNLGRTQLIANKPQEALKNLKAVSGIDANDDMANEFKLLAECLIAKAEALNGNVAAGQAKLEEIIKKEDPLTEPRTFAYAYNAMGACHEKNGKWKDAAIAYLHTELLFHSDPEAHAESLYRLSKIWAKLEETDRANKARSTLRGRYKNSYWAKLQ